MYLPCLDLCPTFVEINFIPCSVFFANRYVYLLHIVLVKKARPLEQSILIWVYFSNNTVFSLWMSNIAESLKSAL